MGFIKSPTSVNDWRETLLTVDQYATAGAQIRQATVLALTAQPDNDETLVIAEGTLGATTEKVFTFKTVLTPLPQEVEIGLTINDTIANLAAAIALAGTYDATVATYPALSDYFPLATAAVPSLNSDTLIIYRLVTPSPPTAAPTDRLYGTVGTATPDTAYTLVFKSTGGTAAGSAGATGATVGYDVVSSSEIQLPVTDTGTKSFGFSRIMTREEAHAEVLTNSIWRFDLPTTTWIRIDPAYIYYAGEAVFTGEDVTYADLSTIFTTANQWGWAKQSPVTASSLTYLVKRVSLTASDITDFRLTKVIPKGEHIASTVQAFTYASSSPVDFSYIRSGDLILSVKLVITTAFNDPTATLNLGTINSTANSIIDAAYIDATIAGTYVFDDLTTPGVPTSDQFRLTLSPAGSTMGAGTVSVLVRRA